MLLRYLFMCLGVSLVSSGIIVTNKKSAVSDETSNHNWWKTATIYQIYVKSFRDTNGDGIGDLEGVLEKLSYIKSIGVQAIWLSPIFDSPQKDNGYDISDYRTIWKTFGTMNDFKKLIKDAHANGLKIIIDFVPNHTSDQHIWFKESVKRNTTYADYYVWRNCDVDEQGKINKYPNNWRSVFGGSAWTYSPQRKQCYLHQFLKEQPDLNYRNPTVVKEMQDILTFWLETNSVDGVRIDAVPHIFEDVSFADEPIKDKNDNTFNGLIHKYTQDQPETFQLIEQFRKQLDNIKDGDSRIEFTEATNLKYYGDGKTNGAHFTFNFQFLDLRKTSTVEDIARMVETYTKQLHELSPDYVPNWVLGNHDTHRIASKVGKEKVDGLNILTAYLPGIQVTYQGEEIGMENGEVDCTKEGQDLKENCTLYPTLSRDFERTPFQWSSGKNAGFSDGKPWLPVAKNYKTLNVEKQDQNPTSHLNVYRIAQAIRLTLQQNASSIVKVERHDKEVLHLSRASSASYVFDYLLNFDGKSKNVTLESKSVIVRLAPIGDPMNSTFTLKPYEGIIISYIPADKSGATTLSFSYLILFCLGVFNIN